MKRILMSAAALLAVAAPMASAQTGSLNGTWLGHYGYNIGAPDVNFQARFANRGARFSGSTIEQNTFGDATAYFLTANVSGHVDQAGAVHFVKTYDGTGGQSHSVQYDGAFDASRQCVTGQWRIGQAGGPFEMCAARRMAPIQK